MELNRKESKFKSGNPSRLAGLRPKAQLVLTIFEHWLLRLNPMTLMRPHLTVRFEAFADARASGNTSAIGGYVSHPSLGQVWFSETFSYSEFARMGVPVKREMQRDIACYEALAQAGLILAVAHLCPCSRVPIRLCSGSDNVGAESGINNTFTTSRPLAFTFLNASHYCQPCFTSSWMSITYLAH